MVKIIIVDFDQNKEWQLIGKHKTKMCELLHLFVLGFFPPTNTTFSLHTFTIS
jgi:hypothetical protein